MTISTAKAALIQFIISFGISIPVTLFGGFILAKMWAWFIAPKFSMPTIGIIDAIGISTLVQFILISLFIDLALLLKKSDNISDNVKLLVKGMIIYPLCLGTAYIWSCFL